MNTAQRVLRNAKNDATCPAHLVDQAQSLAQKKSMRFHFNALNANEYDHQDKVYYWFDDNSTLAVSRDMHDGFAQAFSSKRKMCKSLNAN